MPKAKINPIHPGRVLRLEFMEPMKLTNYALAKAIAISQAHIGRIINGKNPITVDIALRLEMALGMSAQTWLNMQNTYDLLTAKAKSGSAIAKMVKRIRRREMEMA